MTLQHKQCFADAGHAVHTCLAVFVMTMSLWADMSAFGLGSTSGGICFSVLQLKPV